MLSHYQANNLPNINFMVLVHMKIKIFVQTLNKIHLKLGIKQVMLQILIFI